MYGAKLKKIRIEKKLYQKQLASMLDISEISYTHYENEYYIMPIKYLNEICNYFDISLDYLFSFSDKNNYQGYNKQIDKIEVGKRLKEFRKDNKLTQAKLAIFLNSSQSTIADYERGKNLIATPFLYDICKKYKVSADYLLGKIDSPKYLNSTKK